MTTWESLVQAIAEERTQREACSDSDVVAAIRSARFQEALESLIYFTAPADFAVRFKVALRAVDEAFAAGDLTVQAGCLGLLVDMAIGLKSFLPRWTLCNTVRHGDAAMAEDELAKQAAKALDQAARLEAQAPAAATYLLGHRRTLAAARFAAEQADDPEGEAISLIGASIAEYVENVNAAVASSNVRRIAEMRDTGQTLTEISNDYAAFLPYAMLIGASFATTNPPLVDYAWLADLERWNPVADETIAGDPEAGIDELARLMTAEVVLANMRLLRPIFLLTSGGMGCVCLQVNPHNHADPDTMISDARYFYGLLRDKLKGGVPNVVFKLPGTRGGLEACRVLTGQGIGVTITVNFGLFQHIPFAKAMAQGQAIFSCLVEMNGRLAFPVRDELLGRLPELAEHGIDEALAREAAAWSGAAPIKRAYALLRQQGYDLRRYKPLVASLRVYEGDAYANLPSAFPDMTEILGATILSVFPNVRRAFDAVPGILMDPMRIEDPVPDEILAVLCHSEIFRQAYFVADREWALDEDERFRPQSELTLEQDQEVFNWPPVFDTMTQFQGAYDTFVGRILERRQLLGT